MDLILWGILILFIVFASILCYWYFSSRRRYRKGVPEAHVWLEVMDFSDWKTLIILQEELRDRKELPEEWFEKISQSLLYDDLALLVREGLVEERPQIKVHGISIPLYRLTVDGIHWRDQHGRSPSSSSEG